MKVVIINDFLFTLRTKGRNVILNNLINLFLNKQRIHAEIDCRLKLIDGWNEKDVNGKDFLTSLALVQREWKKLLNVKEIDN